MKKILILLTFTIFASSFQAQSVLENTHWNIGPDSIHFQKDTFHLTYIGALKVTGTYTDTATTLTLFDYYGPEACDSTIAGTYEMELSNRKDTLKLQLISDNCSKRAISLDGAILTQIDLYISVESEKQFDENQIYPNPFNDFIYVHSNRSSPYTVKFYNEFGQLQIENEMAIGSFFIDATSLSKGFYIIAIMQDGIMTKKRLIKM